MDPTWVVGTLKEGEVAEVVLFLLFLLLLLVDVELMALIIHSVVGRGIFEIHLGILVGICAEEDKSVLIL